ncbi:hypothetical protein Tco_1362478 [Tanacetum coccineum]
MDKSLPLYIVKGDYIRHTTIASTNWVQAKSIKERRIMQYKEVRKTIQGTQLTPAQTEDKEAVKLQGACPTLVIPVAENNSHTMRHLRVHNTFHVSNLKKCHADEPLAVPLDGLHLDDKLHFVEEPLEIVGREVKRLKRSRIPLVKVRWNSKRGPEFTWEREDQFKKKYPHLFTKSAPSSSAAS